MRGLRYCPYGSVNSSGLHSCAVRTNGGIACWGDKGACAILSASGNRMEKMVAKNQLDETTGAAWIAQTQGITTQLGCL